MNINSIPNKFEMLSLSVTQYVDILMLSETKLDSNSLSTQFLINDFSIPYRLDRNSKGGGILLYVRDKIIVLALNRYSLPPHIEILVYGFDEISLKVIISYLKNHTQTTKVGSLFSELLNIVYGVPQGSILGPLLFIIYICDLFIVNKDVNFSSYADDTTPFITGMSFEKNISKLESILSDISQWFMNNNLKNLMLEISIFFSARESTE